MENQEQERQFNYTIMEGYELPSKGLIYNKPVNAHVELRSMTARDEMKRLAPSTTQFKTLADVIEGCMIEKPAVHVYDMALGDYEFLLHKLRIVTYGDAYKMQITCPFCGNLTESVAHLEELTVKEFDKQKFDELRTLVLPKSGHTVVLKFRTPRLLDSIEAKTKEMKRKYKNAEMAFDKLVLLSEIIDTVDGQQLDPMKLETFIERLPALDMAKILKNIDELDNCLGLDNRLTVDCQECGGEVHTFFRFGQEFFRPTTI